MDIFLMILGVIGGAVLVALIVLLVLKIMSSGGAEDRTDYLASIADAFGGEFGRTGLMGYETVTVKSGEITGKIILFQNTCNHQNRYTTHFIFEVPVQEAYAELLVETTGNSPNRAFCPKPPPKLDFLPSGMPDGLLFYSPVPQMAQNLLGERRFQDFLSRLKETAGLAKFELFQTSNTVKFSIEGHILEKEPLIDLYNLLLKQIIR